MFTLPRRGNVAPLAILAATSRRRLFALLLDAGIREERAYWLVLAALPWRSEV